MTITHVDKIIVHNGVFHADDVMCAALVRCLNPRAKIERASHVPHVVEPGTIVADMGGGPYDHHTFEKPLSERERTSSSCSLLFADICDQLFPNAHAASRFDQMFLAPIDAQDNGGERNPLSESVAVLVPPISDVQLLERRFNVAVDYFISFVSAAIDRAQFEDVARDRVLREYLVSPDPRICLLPEYIPWRDALEGTDVKLVIYPSLRGGWCMQLVSREELLPSVVAGFAGCTFLHAGRFLAAFRERQDALFAALKVLEIEHAGRDG